MEQWWDVKQEICFALDKTLTNVTGYNLSDGDCSDRVAERCDPKLLSEINTSADCKELHYKYRDYRNCYEECAGHEIGSALYSVICQASFEVANPFYLFTCDLETACFSSLDDFVEKDNAASVTFSSSNFLLTCFISLVFSSPFASFE